MAQRNTARKTKSSGKRRTTSPAMKKATASRKTKSSATKATCKSAAKSVSEQEVTIDRRRAHLRGNEVGEAEKLSAPAMPERRQKVNRRRQIDPTTCERDYTGDEIEFMNALDDYKRKSGRMFPTCSEVLEVVRTLGYVKSSAADSTAGQCGSASMAAGSATTKWLADGAECSEVQDVEEMLEEALAE